MRGIEILECRVQRWQTLFPPDTHIERDKVGGVSMWQESHRQARVQVVIDHKVDFLRVRRRVGFPRCYVCDDTIAGPPLKTQWGPDTQVPACLK